MAVYKIFPSKDTTLYSLFPNMNTGIDPIMEATQTSFTPGTPNPQSSRFLVAFDGNKSKLPLKEKMNFEMANLISGQEMPYATLMYIWSGKSPVDTIISNAHTSRIKMIVVDSGWDNLSTWHKHQRDLAADYKRAYGEAPGEVIGIALLTDTDNTKSETRAIYGDIELVRKNPK